MSTMKKATGLAIATAAAGLFAMAAPLSATAAEGDVSVTGGQTVLNPWPLIGGVAMSVSTLGEMIPPDGPSVWGSSTKEMRYLQSSIVNQTGMLSTKSSERSAQLTMASSPARPWVRSKTGQHWLRA